MVLIYNNADRLPIILRKDCNKTTIWLGENLLNYINYRYIVSLGILIIYLKGIFKNIDNNNHC